MTKVQQKQLKYVQDRICKTKSTLVRLRSKESALISTTTVKCWSCKTSSQIGNLVYIQTHWYVRPYGCNGGDYHKSGEGQWDCPKCGANNRLYSEPQIEKLKSYFSSILACYCDQDHSICGDPRPCPACVKAGRTRDGRLKSGFGSGSGSKYTKCSAPN